MRSVFAIIVLLMLAMAPADVAAQTRRSATTVKKERQDATRRISQTRKQIEENSKLMRSRVNALNSLQADIDTKNASIAALQKKIAVIDRDIKQASDSIAALSADVDKLRGSAAKSVRQARSMRQSMTTASLIFSAKDFNELMKRVGYLKQLDKSRNAKTRSLRGSLDLLESKKVRLDSLRGRQSRALASLSQEQKQLAARQAEMEIMVTEIKKNGKALERELAQRQSQAQQLDMELDRIIAEEQRLAQIEEQKRQEAERQRKLEQERIEAERQLALQRERDEAKAREEKAAQEAAAQKELADAKLTKEQKKQAKKERKEQEREAKKRREEIRKKEDERQKELRRQRDNKELAAKTPAPTPPSLAAASAKDAEARPAAAAKASSVKATNYTPAQLSAAFAKNKGAMIFPVEGSHRVVSRFGRTTHASLSKVQLDNSGIDIETAKNANARAIFQGTVTSIFHLDGYHNIVMVRHGEYLTVYANVVDLAVRKGDQVQPGQAIGRVWADPDDDDRSILHFEVRKERQKLNPLDWVR